ncbi:MAG: transposase [Candidatus Omnitrophica bacterium]|nr:transposase [Candidatus Omnitrophota bacterium]
MKVATVGRRGKKQRILGPVQEFREEEYRNLGASAKMELIRALIPLGLMAVRKMLEEEVESLAGMRYSRQGGLEDVARYGWNPGSVRLAGQRIAIPVPRVRNLKTNHEVRLESVESLHGEGDLNEKLLKRVLYGISCRNYEEAAESVPGAIGLSRSSVSREFIQASGEALKAFQERNLSQQDLVALVLDGKTFAEDTMVVALGITLEGEKKLLGFVQTGTENEKALTPFLLELLDRGLSIEEGLLVVIDGGKGLRSAVKNAFKDRVVVQRCQWHKRENVVSHLAKSEQAGMRRRLQRAYQRPTYAEAKSELMKIHNELEEKNQSAASSLMEGMEETMTLHRLGVFAVLGMSLKTTNTLESINSQVEARCRKVSCWKNSNQKMRWLAASLMDIEPRLNRLKGHRHLPLLREALKEELGLIQQRQVA